MNWAFILGGSSGFGLATAKIMATKGYNLFIVHRDRRIKLPDIEKEFETMRASGIQVSNINLNANDKENKQSIINKLSETITGEDKIKLFLHSIADGNLGPITQEQAAKYSSIFCKYVSEDSLNFTINSMGISFLSWSQFLLESNYFSSNARIIGLTSEGTSRVLANYAAISAAKSVLEATSKYMAVEFASKGITTNLINAGITDTPALKVFPNYKEMLEQAKKRNPFGRLTTADDVAKVIALLCTEEASWINGEIIRVDGGEQLIGI